MRIEVICTGDEILSGKTINTNFAHVSRRLQECGLPLTWEEVVDPISLAIAGGLFLGKPIGICLFVWLTVKLGWATRPAGVTWPILGGAAFLGGIGFTMALFIASLGLSGDQFVAAKIGVIMGSFCSAVVGMVILVAVTKKG